MTNENVQTSQLVNQSAGGLIADGKTVQQIQTPYTTAVSVQKPRDLIECERRAVTEASIAGSLCYYGWGVGKNAVEGLSIDGAMIAFRNWGNSVVHMNEVVETRESYIMEAAFVDLETGSTYTRQFRQSKKHIIYGNMDDERKSDTRFQIGQSKAQRNAILKALPRWYTQKIFDKAKEGVKKVILEYINKHTIEKLRKKTLEKIVGLGATLERVEAKYGKKLAAWDADTLVSMEGDVRALNDGIEVASELFPEIKPEESADDSANKSGLSTDDMKPGDEKDHQGYANVAKDNLFDDDKKKPEKDSKKKKE